MSIESFVRQHGRAGRIVFCILAVLTAACAWSRRLPALHPDGGVLIRVDAF
jgi:hypothetical protein